jgi:aromatic-ring opening dioxygenase LigAB LigA subunit
VSVYAVNKLCRRVVHEPSLREALSEDPEPALRAARPALSDEEITALMAGDVGTLSKLGANHFLLHQLGRWRLFGLDLPSYGQRIRDAHSQERAARAASPSAPTPPG